MDHTYKNGDYVQMDFYSHEEPLCSVEGQVSGEFLYVTGGSVPLDIKQVFTTNTVPRPDLKENANSDPGQTEMADEEAIRILQDSKSLVVGPAYGLHDAVEKAVSALKNQASVNTFIDELRQRLVSYGHSHGNNQALEDVFRILSATEQSYNKGDLSPKPQHDPYNDISGRYL